MRVDRINLVATLGGNTGKTLGDVRFGRIKAMLFTRGKVFTAEELADSESFKAALEEAMQLSRISVNKLFLFEGFREADDNTGDPNVAALADGYEEVLNEALPKYVFRNTKGIAQQQALVAFNGWQDGVFLIDDKNILFYKGNNGGAKAFSVGYLYATPPRPGGTGAINTNQVRLTMGSVDEFKTNIGAVKLDFNVADLMNIVDVQLLEVGAAAGYVFKIGAETKYAGTNIYESYADALAQVGAWKATRLDTGANVTVSAVAKNAVLKGWDVTLDNAAAIAADVKIKIELVDPAALAELATPVEGIEGMYVRVVKPA